MATIFPWHDDVTGTGMQRLIHFVKAAVSIEYGRSRSSKFFAFSFSWYWWRGSKNWEINFNEKKNPIRTKGKFPTC